ncbi:MAG: hypothetical protein IJ368_03660, partial [Oscillospiraceae bacterium]|nr:hypothetical protein [Oscillospiraceae bacterium]
MKPKEVSSLPTSLVIYGREYIFHSDFREWMRYELLMTDCDVPEDLRSKLAVDLIFSQEQHVPLTHETGDFISWFYRCGEASKASDEDDRDSVFLSSRLPYRFDVDFPYIYAAFLELYNIDLITVDYLHWWTFKALFRSLHDCKFTEIVGYRMAEIGDMSDSMKQHYLKMQ